MSTAGSNRRGKLRFGFVTCVELGLSCLEEIYKVGGRIDLLMTLHDDRAVNKSGRIYLDNFSQRHGVPLVKIGHINDADAVEAVLANEIDWLFIIGWSQIAGAEMLAAPARGVVGMHPTLLPIGRGRAAVPWAIIRGLERTGVTMFVLDEGVDTGPILGQVEIPIEPNEDASTLYVKANHAHRELIRRVWPELVEDTVTAVPQDESLATEWPGRKPGDGTIQPSMTVAEVDRLVRAVTTPYPGAIWDQDGVRWKVWRGEPGVAANASLVLTLSDGQYSCTEVERESAV